jgi:hypothetical protein
LNERFSSARELGVSGEGGRTIEAARVHMMHPLDTQDEVTARFFGTEAVSWESHHMGNT